MRSRASNACLLVIEALSTTNALASWMTLQSAVPLLMIQTGMSIALNAVANAILRTFRPDLCQNKIDQKSLNSCTHYTGLL